ncbi:MAG: hypothetical protein E5X53_03595 [Mesorhizobium sp.]|uniref:hypothetical protein n=1 Tax=Mesorhizobium sp. TaxID=1871066 RepID=UPI000FE8B5A1|nr:hypothetical protein [Mesorhizobium sp.]RWM23443.1 MAG: hypothetical protein EOR73_04670 [Mesorhizobium sp.]TIP76291.1 MAG: hypothetical protein E5X55_01310 [Mesorhizobium sp.]TIQ15233.1 MAG: hypothetical protein E5X57_01310 [Mesorhizobium sp.]TIR54072.1 MAG: hypothetical protein E5X53_03595 [Mesorhizobium sp.]TJW00332.1 MAG: hypothetical protein E5X52_01305 [Mesorhizobium sp.]
MSNSEEDAQKMRWRGRATLAAFCLLVAASAMTWVVIPHLPTAYTCAFRDTPALRWLWPGNQATYNQISQWHGTLNDQCNLFSTRSMLSVFFATFSIFFYITSLSKAQITMKTGPVITTLVMAFMIVGLFSGGFNDQATGRGAWAAYHTTDSTNVLLWKTLPRMFAIYIFGPVWITHLRVAWLQQSSV